METVTDFIFLGSKIIADSDCSYEIKRCFASWKESYDKPRQHIKKQRHHFADKGPYIKDTVFLVVMFQMHQFLSTQPYLWSNSHIHT